MLYTTLIALMNGTIVNSLILNVKKATSAITVQIALFITISRFTLILDILETKHAKNCV